MTVTRTTYATREAVKSALDIKLTARIDQLVDDAIEAATEAVEGLLKRKFYTKVMTRYWDWPNYQRAEPWRLWFDAWEVADPASMVVTSGGVAIPANTIFWEPANSGPPYTYLELNRASTSAFGAGQTPQRDISITGPFGHSVTTVAAGQLAAAVTDTSGTAITVSNGAALGVGDNFLIDTERMLVADRANVSTGQAQQGAGCSTASNADVALAVTDGTKFSPGEVLQLDSERMLALDVTGNTVTVRRAWDGTVIATHTGATVYASRLLTVQRGVLGTTAATHSNAAPLGRQWVPGLVRDLTVGEAEVRVLQKTGGYARSQGSGQNKQTGIGQGLDDIRAQAVERYGRKMRSRVV